MYSFTGHFPQKGVWFKTASKAFKISLLQSIQSTKGTATVTFFDGEKATFILARPHQPNSLHLLSWQATFRRIFIFYQHLYRRNQAAKRGNSDGFVENKLNTGNYESVLYTRLNYDNALAIDVLLTWFKSHFPENPEQEYL